MPMDLPPVPAAGPPLGPGLSVKVTARDND